MSLRAAIARRVLGLSSDEASFARRGFAPTEAARQSRLEQIGRTFIDGYNRALGGGNAATIGQELRAQIQPDLAGFAFEGAAMALALVDWLTLSNLRRWRALWRGPGDPHGYMVHVGAGWAAARVPWVRRRLEPRLAPFDPLLRWLVIDGYGFHQGYFHPDQFIARQQRPRHLWPAAEWAFDQGLGRSMWFVGGADVDRIKRLVAPFAPPRRSHLWSGVGLACAYAGGGDRQAIHSLVSHAGEYHPQLAQGVAFAAKTRQRAGNLTEHTELACGIICGMNSAEAAAVTDDSLRELPADGEMPAYEIWRRRIQARFADALQTADSGK